MNQYFSRPHLTAGSFWASYDELAIPLGFLISGPVIQTAHPREPVPQAHTRRTNQPHATPNNQKGRESRPPGYDAAPLDTHYVRDNPMKGYVDPNTSRGEAESVMGQVILCSVTI